MKFDKWGFVYPGRREPEEDFGPLELIQIELCEIFINQFCQPTIKPNRNRSTYGFKHDVEKWCGRYIFSGAFAQAALNMGYKPLIQNDNHLRFNIKLIYTPYQEFQMNFPYNVVNQGVPDKYKMLKSGYWNDQPTGGEPWVSNDPRYYEDLMKKRGENV
jgi:hypothetical protein